ncbi:MAG TPA: zinc ribbon domain-containing protein [Terriglobales bacterium]|nr:zinc ribbon domain-containing protein [Terriglobales bacterium]
MPLYDFRCPEGHTREAFFHRAEQARGVVLICECGERMTKALSVGRGLTYFEEGRPRVIENLGDKPVVVRSHREHERLMREAGVTWATRGRGEKGCWA